jgi:hypothetical protein
MIITAYHNGATLSVGLVFSVMGRVPRVDDVISFTDRENRTTAGKIVKAGRRIMWVQSGKVVLECSKDEALSGPRYGRTTWEICAVKDLVGAKI